MNIRRPSFIRDTLGFLVGGILASASAGLVFVVIIPLGDMNNPRNHIPEAFMLTVLTMFFSGGFIGRRGFSAKARSDFFPSITATYLAVFGLPLFAGLSFCEALPFAGFATVGVVVAVTASLVLLRWFPMESLPEER